MADLRNTIFLLVLVIVAFFCLKFSTYGLMVNLLNGDIHEFLLEEFESTDLFKNRYIKIKNATSIDNPIEVIDGSGQIQSYIYPLIVKNAVSDSLSNLEAKILIETLGRIHD